MSANEHRLGEKAHSERFAHSVTDFARKRQEVSRRYPRRTPSTPKCACLKWRRRPFGNPAQSRLARPTTLPAPSTTSLRAYLRRGGGRSPPGTIGREPRDVRGELQ